MKHLDNLSDGNKKWETVRSDGGEDWEEVEEEEWEPFEDKESIEDNIDKYDRW